MGGKKCRIAIYGAGALGTILGAYLARAGLNVELIDVDRAHVDALNRDGAQVTGYAEFTARVRALTPEEMTGTYDYVFYMAKQTANSVALPALLPHLTEDSTVCTCQNGLPEYRVGDFVGIGRVVGVPVSWGATLLGPGRSCLTSRPGTICFVVGRINGSVDKKVREVQEILQHMCRADITTNLIGIRWCKLAMNASFSGVASALGCTFGDILDDDALLTYTAEVAKELADVAAAANVTLLPIEGNDFSGELYPRDAEDMPRVLEKYRQLWDGQRKLRPSMLQDLEKGKVCEIDAINGVVVRYGTVYGVPTPKNERIVEIIKAIQAGSRQPCRENFRRMT